MASAAPNSTQLPSRPWLALALTFLLLGLGYGLPFMLVREAPAGLWQGTVAPEVLNLYALTVFAGRGHFIFAWRGQWAATQRLPLGWRSGYWALVAMALAALLGLRALLGVMLFSALVWVWFVGHFVKAEVLFSRSVTPEESASRLSSYQPVAAFAWLTLVLFNVAHIQERRWLLFACTALLGALMLATGGWWKLVHMSQKLPVVAFFFLGESLVWGTYGPYMTPAFRTGVYVFHVAGASFFHYLGSYAYGYARTRDRWLRPLPVIAVNLCLIGLGASVAAGWPVPQVRFVLTPMLGIGWFTLWVALHQAASDLLPLWKRRGAGKSLFPVAVSSR
jgi:hypothetical protein